MKKITTLKDYKKRLISHKILTISLQLFIFIFVLFMWEMLSYFEIINSFFISSPSRIILTIKENFKNGELFSHIYISTLEASLSFIISLIFGLLIAILLYLFKTLSKILEPYLVLLNALPKSALAPILIIILGTSIKGIVFVSISFVIIINIITILNSFNQVDKDLILMMKSYSSSSLQILFKLIIPYNIVTIISSCKVSIGLAWVGVIVGEFLSSKKGLGYIIMYGGQVFKLDLVMAGIFILSIICFLMYAIIGLFEMLLRKKFHF